VTAHRLNSRCGCARWIQSGASLQRRPFASWAACCSGGDLFEWARWFGNLSGNLTPYSLSGQRLQNPFHIAKCVRPPPRAGRVGPACRAGRGLSTREGLYAPAGVKVQPGRRDLPGRVIAKRWVTLRVCARIWQPGWQPDAVVSCRQAVAECVSGCQIAQIANHPAACFIGSRSQNFARRPFRCRSVDTRRAGRTLSALPRPDGTRRRPPLSLRSGMSL
jgi:hypothetical protein